MSPTALVPIADGSEEIEAVTIIDVLRRAGVKVTVAAVGKPQITAAQGVRLVADTTLSACRGQTFDLIALPGGMPGAEHLRDSDLLRDLLGEQMRSKRLVAAICAAPAVVLAHHGLLGQRPVTCHPAFFERLEPSWRSEERVVVADQLITSRGPGTALEFALALVGALCGAEQAARVAAPMLPATGL